MAAERRLWGIHNDAYGQELLADGYVSIGWPALGDLRRIGNHQAAMRRALDKAFPTAKPGAIAGWAGTLRRFAFEAQEGDLVVFPNKQDRTLSFGVITGPYEYHPENALQPHRRPVRWCRTGVARSIFSQSEVFSPAGCV